MIVSTEDFPKIEPVLRKYLKDTQTKLVATSAFCDPIHPGHISCLEASKAYGYLVVIVNGDEQLKLKKGKAFMPQQDRCEVIDALACVDMVVPFDHGKDTYSIVPLSIIKPDIYTKGGDWDNLETLPETAICREMGTEIITGVGAEKVWASSNYLEEWVKFMNKQED